MPPGKLSAQVAHASVEAVHNSSKDKLDGWKSQGSKKVVLKVKDLSELLEYHKKAKIEKLKTALITDAARTYFKETTITCLAIGPDSEEKIDKVTSKLKML
jgi:PTH2 family peptidyl-tRNA hydrolase